MKLRVMLEPGHEGGFTVTVPALPGCISEGKDRAEALRCIEEAISLYLDLVEDDEAYSPQAETIEISV